MHPWVVGGQVDWDAALVAALPKALSARDDAEFIEAVGTMLASLHDPVTRVLARDVAPVPPAARPGNSDSARTVDGVLILPIRAAGTNIYAAEAYFNDHLGDAKRVVIDLRSWTSEGAREVVQADAALFVAQSTTGVAQEFVEHHGYPPQIGITWGATCLYSPSNQAKPTFRRRDRILPGSFF